MEHGQIFHVVLNTILVYKSKFQASVLESQAIVLKILLGADVTSNVLLELILIQNVQVELVKEWVMKSRPFWTKNLAYIPHIILFVGHAA